MAAKPEASQPQAPANSPRQLPWKARDAHRFDANGHTWKKYGHKILSSEGLKRYYYSCTGKEKHGCQARKVVDRKRFQQQRNRDISNDTVMYEGVHNHNAEPGGEEAEEDRDSEGKPEKGRGTAVQAGGRGVSPRPQPPSQGRRKFSEMSDKEMQKHRSEGPWKESPKKIRQGPDWPVAQASSSAQLPHLQPLGEDRIAPLPSQTFQVGALSRAFPAEGGAHTFTAASQHQTSGAPFPRKLHGTGQPSLPHHGGPEQPGMGLHQRLAQSAMTSLDSAWGPSVSVSQQTAQGPQEAGPREGISLLQGSFASGQRFASAPPQPAGNLQQWYPHGQQTAASQPFAQSQSPNPRLQPFPLQPLGPHPMYGDRSLPAWPLDAPGGAAVQPGAADTPQSAGPTSAPQGWVGQFVGQPGQGQLVGHAPQGGLAQSQALGGPHQHRLHQQQGPPQQPHLGQQRYPHQGNEQQQPPWHLRPHPHVPLGAPGHAATAPRREQLQEMRGQRAAQEQLQMSGHPAFGSGSAQSSFAPQHSSSMELASWARQAPAGMPQNQLQSMPSINAPDPLGRFGPEMLTQQTPRARFQPTGIGQPHQAYMTPSANNPHFTRNAAVANLPPQSGMGTNVHQAANGPQHMLVAARLLPPPPNLGQTPPYARQYQSADVGTMQGPPSAREQSLQAWQKNVEQFLSAFPPIEPGSLAPREPFLQQPGLGTQLPAVFGEQSQPAPPSGAGHQPPGRGPQTVDPTRAGHGQLGPAFVGQPLGSSVASHAPMLPVQAQQPALPHDAAAEQPVQPVQPVQAQTRDPISSIQPGPSVVVASRSMNAGVPADHPMLPYSRSHSYGGSSASLVPSTVRSIPGGLQPRPLSQAEAAGSSGPSGIAPEPVAVPSADRSMESQLSSGVGKVELPQHGSMPTRALPDDMVPGALQEGLSSEPTQDRGLSIEENDAVSTQGRSIEAPPALDELAGTTSLEDEVARLKQGLQNILEDATEPTSRKPSKDEYEALLDYLTSKK